MLASIKKGVWLTAYLLLVLLAGAAGAGAELVGKAGGEVIEAACVIELPELKGREKIKGLPLYVLVEKEGL